MITTVSKLGTRNRRWNTLSSVSYEAWMQAQQSVLGSVLIDDRCASFLVFGLAEEDFCESYRSLYRAIRELYTTGKPVDPVAVLNVVGDSYKEFIVQLMNITPTAAKSGHAQRPRLEDLRSSGQIEQDADGVFFLHPLEEPDKPRELIIAKNKDGALSITKLAFDGARQQFRFIGKGQQPLKPFDYSSYVMPSQVDQYPQLCMDVETPFDAEQK